MSENRRFDPAIVSFQSLKWCLVGMRKVTSVRFCGWARRSHPTWSRGLEEVTASLTAVIPP